MLPGSLFLHQGVDDRQQFVSDGNECHFGRLATLAETLVESLGHWVVTCGAEGSHVQHVAYLFSSPDDVALTGGRSAVVGNRGKPHQLTDDFPINMPQFGELADQGS